MGPVSDPVQHALEALEKLQAEAYHRGWSDAIRAVVESTAALRPQSTLLELGGGEPVENAGANRVRGVRGPQANSIPGIIVRSLQQQQMTYDQIAAQVRAIKLAADDAIETALRRLVKAGAIIREGEWYASRAPEVSDAPAESERSGSVTTSDDRGNVAAD